MPTYTEYNATPANNNSAPPVGAPEGMAPSGVNDAMRYHMAVTRDLGNKTVKSTGGIGMTANAIMIGWNGANALIAQVDNTALGKVWTNSVVPTGTSSMALPNGRKFVWQTFVAGTNASGVGTVTFPSSFTATPTVIICNGDTGTRPDIALGVAAFNTTSFQFTTTPDLPNSTIRVNYVAIGEGA